MYSMLCVCSKTNTVVAFKRFTLPSANRVAVPDLSPWTVLMLGLTTRTLESLVESISMISLVRSTLVMVSEPPAVKFVVAAILDD